MNITDRSIILPVIPLRRPARRNATTSRAQMNWYRSWFGRLQLFAKILSRAWMQTAGTAANGSAVAARVPFSASLLVTPSITHANTPRLLTITAYFPAGCGPTNATAANVTDEDRRVLELRVNTPTPDFAFTDLVLVPYTVELTHTPSEEGDLPVHIVTADGVAIGESVLMTRRGKVANAQFTVTGK